MLSVLLGQRNYSAANKVLGNVVSLNTIIGIIFMIVALIFIDPILYFFGASENTIPYAKEYMKVILYGNVITHLYFGLNSAMRSTGNPRKAMGLTIFTVIFNAILDPIFIFVLDMGIAGAAWATVIAQSAALILIMRHFTDRDKEVHFEKGIFRFDMRVAKDSLAIGFGPFLMNAAACLVSLFINQQFRKYSGDLGIGAYGICNRINFMFVMICLGLNQGMQPIAGYNYGARKYSRVKEVYKRTAIFATMVTVIGFLITEIFPRATVGIFTSDAELLDMSSKGIRIMNIMLPIVGFQIASSNLFQSLGMVKKSIILSLSRQLLFLLPCLYFLPLGFEATGIWMSYPVADGIASLVTVILLSRLFKKFRKLNDGDDPSILGSTI